MLIIFFLLVREYRQVFKNLQNKRYMINDYLPQWQDYGYDPYEGMTEDERLQAGIITAALYLVGITVTLVICSII